jgi:membrane fusion protein, heavy metal efflux system
MQGKQQSLAAAIALTIVLGVSVAAESAGIIKLTAAQRANAQIELLTLERASASASTGLTITGRVEPGSGGRQVVTAPAAGRIDLAVFPGTRVRRDAAILTLAGSDIAALQRVLREARAAATAARQRVVRDRVLLKEGIIAPSRVEQSEAAAAVADAQLRQGSTALPRLALGARDGEVVVRAPRDGVLAGPRLVVGERVELCDTLAIIGAPTRLRVALSASANVARSVRPGDRATLRSRGCEANAIVESVGVGVEANQTVPIDARILGDESCLLPGESVTATVTPRVAAQGSWALPARAFVRRGADVFVFAERPAGFEAVQVDGGAAMAGFARAASLRQGDRVAITGSALLKGAWIGMAEEE